MVKNNFFIKLVRNFGHFFVAFLDEKEEKWKEI